MSLNRTSSISFGQTAAALSIGTVAVLMVGLQPLLLGELVDAKQVSLDAVGVMAMGEIVTLGLGVALGDALLPWSRLRMITICAGLLSAAFDVLTTRAVGPTQMIAVRAGAGLAEGVLVWGTTGVIVRTINPSRVAGIFFVVQTIAQAAMGAMLANLVIPHSGWRGGFELLAAMSLVPCILAFAQPARLPALATELEVEFQWSLTKILPLLVVFFQLATLGAVWAYIEPLGKAAGLDSRGAQTLISGVLAMQVIGGTFASLFVRRFGPVATLMVGSVVLIALMTLFRQLPSGDTLHFAIVSAAMGFVWLFLLPFQIGFAFRADPTGRLAVLVPAAQLLGCAFGPLMASFLVVGEDAAAVPKLSMTLACIAFVVLIFSKRRLDAVGRLARTVR